MRAWHLRWFIPLNLIALMLLIGWWWMSSSPLARLRAADEATTFEELLGPPLVGGKQNIAEGLRDSLTLIAPDSRAIGELNDLLSFSSDPSEHLNAAGALMSRHARTLERIDSALNHPRYRTQLSAADLADPNMKALLEHTQSSREMARFLNLVSLTAIYGDDHAALASVMRQLGHAKAIEGEPAMTLRMVACAVQGMALENAGKLMLKGLPNEQDATSLDAALARIEDRSSLEWALRSERVFAISRFEAMPPIVGLMEQSGVLAMYERAIDAAGNPLDELAAAGQRLTTESGSGSLAKLLAPAIQALFEAEARVGLQARQLRQTLKTEQETR